MPTINVTQEHINAGGDTCNNCPIALAMLEAMPNCNPGVWPNEIFFWNVPAHLQSPVKALRYLTTKEVRTFINAYDAGSVVSPFSFELPE